MTHSASLRAASTCPKDVCGRSRAFPGGDRKMRFDPYHPDGDDGALGATEAVAIGVRLHRIDGRFDRIEVAVRRIAPLPGALSPQQVTILALQDELAALRRCLGIMGDGGSI